MFVLPLWWETSAIQNSDAHWSPFFIKNYLLKSLEANWYPESKYFLGESALLSLSLLIFPSCYWVKAEIDNNFHKHTRKKKPHKHCGSIFVYFNSPNDFVINVEHFVTFAMKLHVAHVFTMIDRGFLPGASCLLTEHQGKSIWDGPWLSHFPVMCTLIYMFILHKEQKSSQQPQNGIWSL